MNPTLANWLTIFTTGIVAAIPQYIDAVPPEYKPLATAGVAVLGSLFHLYQTSPSNKTP